MPNPYIEIDTVTLTKKRKTRAFPETEFLSAIQGTLRHTVQDKIRET
jgi:hypothetical protein